MHYDKPNIVILDHWRLVLEDLVPFVAVRSSIIAAKRKKKQETQSNIWISQKLIPMGHAKLTMKEKISTREKYLLSTLIHKPLSTGSALIENHKHFMHASYKF